MRKRPADKPRLSALFRRAERMALADQSHFDGGDERRGGMARFFGVIVDPKTYGAMLYMVLALGTGIVYFTWVVTGVSLSLGTLILIIGVPLALLFLATVRLFSYFEGYLAQGLLGADLSSDHSDTEPGDDGAATDQNLWGMIKSMLSDGRTWTSMIYMVLQLGLGIVYFTFVVTTMSVSLSFILAPFVSLFNPDAVVRIDSGSLTYLQENMAWAASLAESPYVSLALVPIGLALLFVSLHIMRAVGGVHRRIAEALLVHRG
ncbi:MAG: hypothetical protein EP347_13140 [Alphaproteobacteria bacterium]|nr:MAG: hypothetical protein EP347_13140 [Alphaproteobacteria bacterium]